MPSLLSSPPLLPTPSNRHLSIGYGPPASYRHPLPPSLQTTRHRIIVVATPSESRIELYTCNHRPTTADHPPTLVLPASTADPSPYVLPDYLRGSTFVVAPPSECRYVIISRLSASDRLQSSHLHRLPPSAADARLPVLIYRRKRTNCEVFGSTSSVWYSFERKTGRFVRFSASADNHKLPVTSSVLRHPGLPSRHHGQPGRICQTRHPGQP